MKRNAILVFFIVLSLLSVLTIQPVSATEYTLVDWDDFPDSSQDSANSLIHFYSANDRSAVENDVVVESAPNTLESFDDASAGVVEADATIMLLHNYSYINKITIYLKITYAVAGGNSASLSFTFYNNTSHVLAINFKCMNTPKKSFNYLDASGTSQELVGLMENSGIYRFEITHISTNQMNYSLYNETDVLVASVEDSAYTSDAWTTFTKIDIDGSHTPAVGSCSVYTWIDDIIINTEGEAGAYPSLDNCDAGIGVIALDSYQLSTKPYLLQVNKIITTANITAVNLLVQASMYSNGATAIDFECKMNSYNLGHASTFTRVSDDYWRVTWSGFSHQIEGEMVWLTFKSNINWVQSGETRYWAVGVTDKDLDGDGWRKFTNYNDDLYWNNFQDNRNYREMSIGSDNIVFNDLDIIYSLCTADVVEGSLIEFIDDVNCFPASVSIGDYVNTDYTVSITSFGYENHLNISSGGVEYVNFSVEGQDGTYNFVPYVSGSYTASLIRTSTGAVLASDTFTVTGSLGENYIYSIPSQTKSCESFKIYYNYSYTTYDGKINIVLDNTVIDSFNIETSTEGFLSMSGGLSNEGVYTLKLYMNKNGSLYQLNSSRHVVTDEHTTYLDISDSVISVPKTITIWGSHNHIGADITIRDNGNVIKNIGSASDFTFYHYVETSGKHNFTMVLTSGADNIILDYEILDAGGYSPPQEPDVEDGEFFGLPVVYMNALFGAFITLGFLIIPFALATKSRADVSNVVYAIFGGVGLGVSTLAGFFPLWLPLMITILMVTVLVIEYKKGN